MCVAYIFLLFEHILKLKLVDPKINRLSQGDLLLNWTAVNIMSSIDVTSCTDEINNMHITCTEVVDICANCGKEGSDGLKACTACKLVKYCNRDCQIAHRSKHKKACRKRAAELHDENLFKQPPPKEDCPICLLRLPELVSGSVYKSCCGKFICCGCRRAPVYDNLGNEIIEEKCQFCRTPAPYSDEEYKERLQKRVGLDDAKAMFHLGCKYSFAEDGFPQDYKAFELFVRAGDLGSVIKAYCSVGYAYENGNGVEVDKK